MTPTPGPAHRPGRDPLPRLLSAAALLIALVALVFSIGGPTQSQGAAPKTAAAPTKAKGPGPGYVKLDAKGKIPARYLPTVPSAKNAQTLGGKASSKFAAACPVSNAIDMGSWCLEGTTFKIPTADIGKNDYLYATQKCVAEGGWLPSAAQLIGAAPKIALKSTLDDDPATSLVPEVTEPRNGIKDEAEMSGDLFTTTAGGAAAGSEGVTVGSKGATTTAEPDPIPAPADPLPGSLDYIRVYDNHDIGGFAGGKPVGQTESFRCAYAKGYQGKPRNVSSRS